MQATIRPARETDRSAMAEMISDGFGHELDQVAPDRRVVARAIVGSLNLDRFIVIEEDGEVVATAALSNNKQRCMTVDDKAFRKQFGAIKGSLIAMIFKAEYARQLPAPDDTGYVELLTVREDRRLKGYATALLNELAASGHYDVLLADPPKNNQPILSTLKKFGFEAGAEPLPFKFLPKENKDLKLHMSWRQPKLPA